MARDWLPAEVDRLIVAYKAGDWGGVHATIDRILELDRDGVVVITAKEAAQCAAALFTEDGIWGLDPQNRALAERLSVASSKAGA